MNASGKIRVLIVDDSASVRQMMTQILSSDPEIEVVGADIADVNFHFDAHADTLASRGQKMIYWGALKPLEHLLLRTPLAPWSYIASRLYHDAYWYNFIGRRRVRDALQTDWGKLFAAY